jgi:hypothetical protein
VLEVHKLPGDEFYVIRGPDDLNPTIVRQWDACLVQSRKQFHPVFALWHELAKLPQKDFAARAGEILRSHEPKTNVSPGSGSAQLNRLVLQAFATNTPTSMKGVAQCYGELLSNAHKAWRDALKEAEEKKLPAPAALSDPAQEELRQVIYAADSPVLVPKGAIVDLEWFFDESTRVEVAKLQSEIDRWIIKASGTAAYSVILEDRATQRNPRVFVRGNPANKGEEVPRQFLEVLAGENRKPFASGSGRLELAEAITSKDNPLTARVMVNRVWLHHFGVGLVKTSSDFGARSEPPSHPELLDWLARQFMAEGWSLKKLHRLIMLSAVYEQSSDVSERWMRTAQMPMTPVLCANGPSSIQTSSPPGEGTAARTAGENITSTNASISPARIDPENRLLWRFNRQRLDFEAMRDSLLAVAGELDMEAGGKPVDLLKKPFATRRTVYGYIDRQFLPGVFRVFDFANPDMHSPQRPDTTVPQQALFFMNSPFVVGRARTLAGRTDSLKQAEASIERLYRAVYQRPPTVSQIELGKAFIERAEGLPPPERPKPVVSPWQYGYGEFDAQSQRTKTFEMLPHFTGEGWQGGKDWPDAKLGWVQLTAEGGHAGNDLQHAAVRRWVAPMDGKISVKGELQHEHKEGDGIVGRIISSRSGKLGTWELHDGKAETKVEALAVKTGETIDFIVDYGANLNSDDFKWVPVIKLAEAGPGAPPTDYGMEWHAKKDFSGPPEPPPPPLNAWEKYAQVLLLSNEFMFVD